MCDVWSAGNCRHNPCSMRSGTDRNFRAPWDEKRQHNPTSCFPLQCRGRSSFSQLLNHRFWDSPKAADAPRNAVLCYHPQPLGSWCTSSLQQGDTGGLQSWPGSESETFPGDKCEDVKTPLLSAEPSGRGEQGLISLQLCAKWITGESEGITSELKGFKVRWKVAAEPGKQGGSGRVFTWASKAWGMLGAGGLLNAIKNCSVEEREQHSSSRAGDSCRNAFLRRCGRNTEM